MSLGEGRRCSAWSALVEKSTACSPSLPDEEWLGIEPVAPSIRKQVPKIYSHRTLVYPLNTAIAL